VSYAHGIGRNAIPALMCFAFVISSHSNAGGQRGFDAPSGCCSIVSQALSAVDRVKVGSSRADVEKAFEPDGGLFSREHTVYVFKRCPSIKIAIDFSLDKYVHVFASGAPTDQVVSVSKPYLEYPVRD